MLTITKIIHYSGLTSVLLLALLCNGCSGDKSGATDSAASAKNQSAKKTHYPDRGEATETVKHKFITAFANKCVSRELKNSNNKDVDEKRFTDSCTCIAKHIAEDLADVDAEKYLLDHEDTQALEIKFDSAAFFCLQSKPQPKSPHFGK
jgi:hypothetical protein